MILPNQFLLWKIALKRFLCWKILLLSHGYASQSWAEWLRPRNVFLQEDVLYIYLVVLFSFAFCKHRDLFSVDVRQAWVACFSDQHLTCLWSYSWQWEHPLSLETWDEQGEAGKRTFLDILLSSQPCVCEPRNLKAKVTLHAPAF